MSQANDPLLAVRDALIRGDFAAASDWLSRFVEANPDDARAWGLLGKCQRELRRFSRADASLTRSLALDPSLLASRREMALLCRDFGDLRTAISSVEALLALTPNDVGLWWELAKMRSTHEPGNALLALAEVRRLRPDDIDPVFFSAQMHFRLRELLLAQADIEWVLRRQPQHADAFELLYFTVVGLGTTTAIRASLSGRLAALAPTARRLLMHSQDLCSIGDFVGARAKVDAALQLAPEDLTAQWAHFQQPDSPAPQSDAAAAFFIRRWSAGLAAFEQVDFSEPLNQLDVWGCIGQSTAFYRHYLQDNFDEQRRYGALVASMMAAIDAGVAARPMRQKRRVGFCCAYFRFHTVTRLFAPLIEALGAFDFELEVFALDGFEAGWDTRLQRVATLHSGRMDAPDWRKLIAGRELDVLVYPEIGMHPLAAGLAGLRLAPVQVSLWGHPVSSGLPTIDYVLSPDSMEPANAQQAYSERLQRLPGLGHGLQASDYPPATRVELNPPAGTRINLLCAQTVYKLMPVQDGLFARILAALPHACLHMLVDDRPPVLDWLMARMTPILRAHGVNPDRQLRLHGFLEFPQFLGLAEACDLNLDSVNWSGGMSALDLLSQGLPVLTTEGESMRARQTAAMLRLLDVPELIANDHDTYVERAVALAQDQPTLAAMRSRLLANRGRLFECADTVAALAEFLRTAEPPAR
ncbi:MAG: O-linked N-acetylglucosamine transferase, SPINDLY family protein [Pseudomarimonas sp.]